MPVMASSFVYEFSLIAHSVLRAAFVVLLFGALWRSFDGWRKSRAWDAGDKSWWLPLTIVTDVQLTIGLLLYFAWSPVASQARASLSSGGMKDPVQRFWAMEHFSSMVLVVLLVHVAKIVARRSTARPARGQLAAFVMLLVGAALVARMTPWPWSKHEGVQRPVVRGVLG
jgi:hypothetical protein